jgi:tRNA modification GTPase
MHHRSTQDSFEDTIVAQSTARGPGAIAIVRLSGPQAVAIAAGLCGQAAAEVARQPSFKLQRRRLTDAQGAALDDAMLVRMPAPNTYTGQDVVELHLHGAQSVVRDVLSACRAGGARDAQGGEFTLRAFINGRMDLAQAEAVGTLIGARNAAQRQHALRLLDGALSRKIAPMIDALEPVIAAWRAVLDFPEYPTGDAPTAAQLLVIGDLLNRLHAMIRGAKTDLDRPYQVALCGAPNTGKSTLLNLWAQDERALVDSAPGTTRDAIGVELSLGEVSWLVWDTAGIRAEAQGVEAQGVALSRSRGAAADRVLWLMSAHQPYWPPADWPHVVVVASRADEVDADARAAFARQVKDKGLAFWGFVSGKTQEGAQALQQWAASPPQHADDDGAELSVVKARQLELLRTAADSLRICVDGQKAGLTLDVALGELELTGRCLGAILGRDVDAAVLDRVFKDFCIGK